MIKKIASLRALLFQFWFWLAQLPFFVLAYFTLSTEAFTSFTLLYLGIVTIITAGLGALSSYVAEEVRVKQEKDADVQDVLDKLDDMKK